MRITSLYRTLAGLLLSGPLALAADPATAGSSVSGTVRNVDRSPRAVLPLVLVEVENNQRTPKHFDAVSDAEGHFLFDNVSPGVYLLGSNIMETRTATIPSTYYPGKRTAASAIPIGVKPEARIENLDFVLPDFGSARELSICVIDATGRPVPAAAIDDTRFEVGTDIASIGSQIKTNKSGCVSVMGLSGASYYIAARHGDWYSKMVVVPPGENSRRVVLMLLR